MAKKLKLPKKIGGVKIPKSVRKGPVAQFLASPGGQVAMAEALVIAAGVFASTRDSNSATGQALRHPGESLKAVGRSTVKAKDSVARGSRKLSHAFAEGMKSFRAALHDEDVEAALAHEAEALRDDEEDGSKKKRSSSSQTAAEPRYPSGGNASPPPA
jgi:hypothetical protein